MTAARARLRAALVAGALLAAAVASPGSPAIAHAKTKAATTSPNPSSTFNALSAVSSVSKTDAWAVGNYTDDGTGDIDTLVLHWNGTQWSQVPSPNPSSTLNTLVAVRAVSATNVWAVGWEVDNTNHIPKTLIEHWNGSEWSVIKSPSPSPVNNALYAVNGGGSQGGVWAVGTDLNEPGDFYETLALRWNGTKWTRVVTPNPSGVDNSLRGVREPSPNNAWAVGAYAPIPDDYQTLILHWNGTKWSRVKSPNPSAGDSELNATSGASPPNGWAVGHFYYTPGFQYATLTVHWNGHAWSKVASPSPSSSRNELTSVRAITVGDAWAVGQFLDDGLGIYRTLALHWNGTKWSQVKTPNPGDAGNSLAGVTATSSTDVWAVGQYSTGTGTPTETLILHWNGHSWVQK